MFTAFVIATSAVAYYVRQIAKQVTAYSVLVGTVLSCQRASMPATVFTSATATATTTATSYVPMPVSERVRTLLGGKHFLGYSDLRIGWDRTVAEISDQRIEDFFQPYFQTAIDSGLKSTTIDSGQINGELVHASHRILTDLLRNRTGFQGVAVTNWEDIIRLVRIQKEAANEKEATFMAIDAEVDVAMTACTTTFCTLVKELVQEGRLTEERIKPLASRILQMKEDIGLFDNPMPRTDHLSHISDPALKEHATQAAGESIVLLKNTNNMLPLTPGRVKRLLVVGPSVDSRANLAGSWTLAWQGRSEAIYPAGVLTIYAALKEEYPAAQVETVAYREEEGALSLARVTDAARKADVIMMAVGERPYTEGLGNTGARARKEVALWFLTDDVGRITRPVRLLKHFEKIDFKPGESRDLVFEIEPQRHLTYPDGEGRRQLENGYFTLRIGDQLKRFRYEGTTTQVPAQSGRAIGAIRVLHNNLCSAARA